MTSLEDISIHRWIRKHNIRNERGDPISFDKHLFLFDIYSDKSPHLAVMKAAQVGMSTCEILRMLWMAKKMQMDIVYTLPTETDVMTFVGGKVNRIIAQNPILQEYTQDKDTTYQKQVGNSMIYFRGTFTKKAAIMVTADWLIHDEVDSSKQDVIEQYQSRLQHSSYKWKHTFSHPFVPSHGVHLDWKKSDQKHWFIKCSRCSKKQYMEWPDSVNLETKEFICKHCHKTLSYEDRRRGEWVAKYKSRDISGYWVNLLMAPWVEAKEIVDKFIDPNSTKAFFWNMILGLPYEGEENVVKESDLLRNITDEINSQEKVVIGCDSGLIKHFVVGNSEGMFYYGKCEDWKEIEVLMKRYPRAILVVDALPDLTGPRQLREKFPSRVFLSYYQIDRKSYELVRWEEGVVKIDRNRMIQHIVDEFKERLIPLQGTPGDWSDYIEHWQNIYRTEEEDNLGQPKIVWQKKNTEDHWVHASVYWRAGVSRFGQAGGIVTSKKSRFASGVEVSPDGKVPLNPDHYFGKSIVKDWRKV